MRRIYSFAGVAVALLVAASIPSMEDYRTEANKLIILADDLAIPDALQRRWDEAALQHVKESLLVLHPELSNLSGRALVLALRDIAYRTIALGSKGGNLQDIWAAYDEAVVLRTAEHSCQGINMVYRIMLTAFGIRSREADFYGDNDVDPGEVLYSHASSDVLIDGHWEASDATFNVSVRDKNGNRLTWESAFKIVNSGGHVKFDNDGLEPIKGRTPKAAEDGILQAMKYAVTIGERVRVKPGSWNGVVRLAGSLRLDLEEDSAALYYRLPYLVQ